MECSSWSVRRQNIGDDVSLAGTRKVLMQSFRGPGSCSLKTKATSVSITDIAWLRHLSPVTVRQPVARRLVHLFHARK